MQSVLETRIFSRRADALLSREERAELIWTLAHNPLAGDLIPGTGACESRGSVPATAQSGAASEWFITFYMMICRSWPSFYAAKTNRPISLRKKNAVPIQSSPP